MSPIIPVLGLGAIAAIALASSKSSAAPATTTGPAQLPQGADDITKLASVADIPALNQMMADANTPASALRAEAMRLKMSPLGSDPAIQKVINALEAKAVGAPTQGGSGPMSTPPMLNPADIATRTPGVTPAATTAKPWQGLSVEQQSRVAGMLIALGVNPQTGTLSPGKATTTAVAASTAYAGELVRLGHALAGNTLRTWAEKAASHIPCKVPQALSTLPSELACGILRTGQMEKDPKKIRAFIAQLQPFAHIPQVKLAIQTLEQEARHIESMQDQADALRQVDAIQKNKPVPTPNPPGMSPQLERAMTNALSRLEKEGAAAAPYAIQIGKLLKANGYPTEGDKIIALAESLKARSAPAPTGGVYVVKTGDYPYAVAKRLTGDGNRWRELQAANPQYNFLKRFTAGMRLKLPAGWSGGSAPAPTPSIPVTRTTPSPTMTTVVTPQKYTVKTGDFPYKLAQKWTGDANRWRELQAANPQYNFLKKFHAGMVLTVPSNWGPKPASIAGSVCAGDDCGCVGCGPVISGAGYNLTTHFEQRGHKLLAHGYLHSKDTGPRLFTVAVDMRPIARAVAKMHKKLHLAEDMEVSGEMDDCVGAECIEIGKFRLRRRKSRRRKSRFSLRKIVRSKAIKKLSRAARDIVDPRKYKRVKKTALAVAAAVYPPAGAPALKAYNGANAALTAIDKMKRKKGALKRRLKSASSSISRVRSYAKKTYSSARSKLTSRAARKGLFGRFGKGRVTRKISSLARGITKKKLGTLLRKAPSLRRTVTRATSLMKKVRSPMFRRALSRATSGRALSQVKRIIDRAKQGNYKAKRAAGILRSVAEARRRIEQRTRGALPAGTTGVLLGPDGRTQHGRFKRLPAGTAVSTLITPAGKMPGHYSRLG